MKEFDYWNTPHPFLKDPGTDQSNRNVEALDPVNSPVDGRSTKDLLNFVYHFSRYVLHYDHTFSRTDWQDFFSDSAPFLLARFQNWDLEELNNRFQRVRGIESCESQP